MSNPNLSRPTRRSIRLQGYDYRQSGAYFVTICTYQQARHFGTIRDGKMEVNELGRLVTECWRQISQVRSYIRLDEFVLMPNHLHGIRLISDPDSVECFASSTRSADASDEILARASLAVIVGQFKRAVTIRSKLLAQPPEQPIWLRIYYERIIRNEHSLNDIRKYIVENPVRWHGDSLYVK